MKDNYDLESLVRKKSKRINVRKKGNNFTNKICEILNERFNTKEFCKTPGSGAFATMHVLPDYMRIYSDIITPKEFKFSIECKKGYNKENLGSLFNTKSEIYNFIEQAKRDSQKSNKEFLIILQQDRKEVLAMFKTGMFPVPNPIQRVDFNDVTICRLKDILVLPDSYFMS